MGVILSLFNQELINPVVVIMITTITPNAYQTTAGSVKLLFFIYEKIHILTIKIEKFENSLHAFDNGTF